MGFKDLHEFIDHLEANNELVRIRKPVSPDQEITIIQHRVIAEKGPALLFENVKGSSFPIVTNLFGTRRRVNMVFHGQPEAVGERIVELAHAVMPPSISGLWRVRRQLISLTAARLKKGRSGPVLENRMMPPDLTRLPVLTCWPEDGGPFITLPIVQTVDPEDGRANIGMYRLQRYGAQSTGMHWQIEKGGGFHFHRAAGFGRPLPVSVILGGPPSLIIAAIAPMPEGLDERLLSALIMGEPLEVIIRQRTGHGIPAGAEFLIEGTVTAGDEQMEGPFGDHLGYYSNAASYPVFRVSSIHARKNAIYPATIVGKPVQEDYYIGEALQKMALPLLQLIRPAVYDLWAYPETGFHPLAVISVRQSYEYEALKHVMGMLGEGQVSLTKVMIAVGEEVDVKDFRAVSRAVWQYLDPESDIHLISPTAQDTLDFTGPRMNVGSRLILLANRHDTPGNRNRILPPSPPPGREVDENIICLSTMGPAFLMVKTRDDVMDINRVQSALAANSITRQYLFHILASEDVPLTDDVMTLWGWFTRFDPNRDLHPAQRRIAGNRIVFEPPILIDARWKKGYPKPVEFDPALAKKVAADWHGYEIS
ncbi:MAG: UbiD family decarboxylase [Desulfobacteraceae bacterium]|nr:UbiD family decarboxylase [Desulfobacteraceae bacterium]